MVFKGDSEGHIEIEVSVLADPVRPIRLEFRIFLDQTHLQRIIEQIEQTFVRSGPSDGHRGLWTVC